MRQIQLFILLLVSVAGFAQTKPQPYKPAVTPPPSVTNASQVGGLMASNNFSDLTNFTQARLNLGLGTLAIQDAGSVNITGGSINGAINPVFNTGSGTNIITLRTGTISHSGTGVFTFNNAILVNGATRGQYFQTQGNEASTGGSSGMKLQIPAFTANSTSGGTDAVSSNVSIGIPTITATNALTTNTAYNVLIGGDPAAGTNQTINNSYGLGNLGKTFLGGLTTVGNDIIPSVSNSYNLGTGALTFRQGVFGTQVFTPAIRAYTVAGITFMNNSGTAQSSKFFDNGGWTFGSSTQRNTANVVEVTGPSSFSGTVDVQGTLNASGFQAIRQYNSTLNFLGGGLLVGATTQRSTGNILEVTGTSSFSGDVGVSGNLSPTTDGTQSLGVDGKSWSNTRIGTIYTQVLRERFGGSGLGFANYSGTSWGQVFSDGNWLLQTGGTANNNGAKLQVGGTSTFSQEATFSGGLTISGGTRIQATNSRIIVPVIQGATDLAFNNNLNTATWAKFYNSTGNFGIGTSSDDGVNKLQVNGSGTLTGNTTVGGNFSVTSGSSYFGGNATFNGGASFGGGSYIFNSGVIANTIRGANDLSFTNNTVSTTWAKFYSSTGNLTVGRSTELSTGEKVQIEGALRVTQGVRGDNYVISGTGVSSAYTIDMSASDNVYVYLTLTGNTTLTLSNYAPGKHLYLRIEQGGAGGFTVTFPTGVRFPGGAAIDWNTAAGSANIFDLVASSTTALDGFYSKQ